MALPRFFDGNVLRKYDAPVPPVLQFQVPRGARAFVLAFEGQRFVHPLV